MKKIVIIGGGFAGAYCARKLERDFEVTLIDTKDYFEFTPAVLRTIVDPAHLKKIQVLHRHYLHKAKILREEVRDITPLAVKGQRGSQLYDYLIISSGSTYNTPIKEKNLVIASRADELRSYAHQVQEAASILIIGGGLVGTELAAEIITRYPAKKITLVHAAAELLERNPAKARQYAQKFLERRGVTILLNERVVSFNRKRGITDRKTTLTADLAFLCTGIKPNYEFLKKNFAACLNGRNNLVVNDFLQLPGQATIFAAGDITAIAEEKTAQNAEKQAEVVVKNIYHLEQQQLLVAYHSLPRVMVISLGEWKGIAIYKNFVLTGIIPGILKQLIEWKTMRKYRK